MEHVVAFLLLVFLSWVQGAAPARHTHARSSELTDAHRVARASGSCQSMQDCAWGYTCAQGACVEAECHGARRVSGRSVGAKRCLTGLVCAYEDGASATHGVGVCDAP